MRPNILSKLVIACLCVLMTSILVNAQSVGMSGTAFTPDSDAILELKAIDKGFLLPRMTTGQRTTYTAAANSGAGLGAAEEGMSIYNSSTNEYNVWDGTQWVMIGGTTSGAGFIENQMAAAQSAADFWIDGKGIVDVLGVGTTAALSSRVHIHDASATAGESLLLIDDNASSPVLQVQDIGRVGIGTASPVSTLDVVGKGTVQFGGDVLVLDPGYVSGASLALGTLATPDTYLRFGNSGGTLNYLDTKGHDFHLYSTATTPGLYFQESDGFVGIGTSTPLAPLHVENDVVNNTIQDVLRLQNHASAGGNGGAIQFRSHWNNGGSFWTMGRVAAIEQNGFGGQLVFYTNEGTGSADDVTPEAMRINEDGNLGIGSTNPTEHLHVVSSSNGDGSWDEGIHIENTGVSGEAALSFSNDLTGANYWFTGLNQSNDYDIGYGTSFTNANNKLRILDNGRVGIGTVGPTQMLHVVGNGRFTTLGGGGVRNLTVNNNGDLVAGSTSVGDITGVTAGDGMTGGGTGGAVTLNVVATNGLTDAANDIRLGGTLVQATTITQGTHAMNFNLNSTGDFNLQDNGTTITQFRDDGVLFHGDDMYWRDGSYTGTDLMTLIDDGNDGRLRIYENGVTSVDLDANSQFVFNEQGFDRDFRVESDDDANMFRIDANNNRVGLRTGAPTQTLDVNGAVRIRGGTPAVGDVLTATSTDGTADWQTPATNGVKFVPFHSDAAGTNFWTHPDINVSVSFNNSTEQVTFHNNSGGYWDAHIRGDNGSSASAPTAISNDVANGGTLVLDLGSTSDGGFTITAGDECCGTVQGFTMQMAYWSDNLSGLISYW